MTTATQELSLRAPKVGPWIIGYAASVSATFVAVGSGLVTNPTIGLLLWIPMALCVIMIVYTSWQRHRLLGTLSPASRSFWRRIVGSTIFTFAGFAVSALAWEYLRQASGWSNFLGLLPYAGFAGIIWSVHQYVIDEGDEYLRMQATRQILIAGFVTLIVAAVWGGLAYSRALPPGWIGIVILVWFGGLGVGRLYNELRP